MSTFVEVVCEVEPTPIEALEVNGVVRVVIGLVSIVWA